MRTTSILVFGLVVSMAAGCSGRPDGGGAGTTASELGGRPANEPSVLLLQIRETIADGEDVAFDPALHIHRTCTATLISPSIAITSAACVDYVEEPVENTDGGRHEFGWLGHGTAMDLRVIDFRSVTNLRGARNAVTLVRLDGEAAPGVARHLRLQPPSTDGEAWLFDGTVYGYGSDGVTCRPKAYRLRKAWRSFVSSNYDAATCTPALQLCPGDTGAPVFDDDGDVRAIYQGTEPGGTERFVMPYSDMQLAIATVVEEWGGGPLADDP